MATTCQVCGVVEEGSSSGKFCTRDNLLSKLFSQSPRHEVCGCGEDYLQVSRKDRSCGRCFARRMNKKGKATGQCKLCERQPVYLYHSTVPVCFVCMNASDKRVGLFAICKSADRGAVEPFKPTAQAKPRSAHLAVEGCKICSLPKIGQPPESVAWACGLHRREQQAT